MNAHRKPSNERIRVSGNANDVVWIECKTCCGDGWHYPMGGYITPIDRARKTLKVRCDPCDGRGARQVPRIMCEPGARIVPAPRGFNCSVGKYSNA